MNKQKRETMLVMNQFVFSEHKESETGSSNLKTSQEKDKSKDKSSQMNLKFDGVNSQSKQIRQNTLTLSLKNSDYDLGNHQFYKIK